MMMKRIIALAAGVMIAAGSLAGCGKKGSSKSKDVSAVYGSWVYQDSTVINVNSDKTINTKVSMDATDMMSFEKDGSITFGGQKAGEGKFDFDGETYVLHMDSADDLTMKKKTPGSKDDMYGEYTLISGVAYDSIVKGYDNRAAETNGAAFKDSSLTVGMEVESGKTSITVVMPIGSVVDSDTLRISFENEERECEYEVVGDELHLKNTKGEEKILKRKS
jgi:hypothetical protein